MSLALLGVTFLLLGSGLLGALLEGHDGVGDHRVAPAL